MIRFGFTRGFEKSLRDYPPQKKIDIKRQSDAFLMAADVRQIPPGFGLTKLAPHLWEIRVDISIRVLFEWRDNNITLLFVGNHNEVQKFIRHYR